MLSPSNGRRCCLQCCQPIVGGSPKKIFCSHACKTERRRHKRAASGTVIIGTELSCKKCGAAFIKQHKRHFYCSTCTPYVRPLERKIGQPWPCENCSTQIIVTHPRMKYCSGCRVLQQGGLLDSIRAQNRIRLARKRKTDPKYTLNRRIGCAVWRSIGDEKKGRPWETLLGFTVEQLAAHLERQFLPGMTWDNRDKWHVDHIVPLVSFDFTTPEDEGFKAAWAITNLRPLWSGANVRKGGKRQHLL